MAQCDAIENGYINNMQGVYWKLQWREFKDDERGGPIHAANIGYHPDEWPYSPRIAVRLTERAAAGMDRGVGARPVVGRHPVVAQARDLPVWVVVVGGDCVWVWVCGG